MAFDYDDDPKGTLAIVIVIVIVIPVLRTGYTLLAMRNCPPASGTHAITRLPASGWKKVAQGF